MPAKKKAKTTVKKKKVVKKAPKTVARKAVKKSAPKKTAKKSIPKKTAAKKTAPKKAAAPKPAPIIEKKMPVIVPPPPPPAPTPPPPRLPSYAAPPTPPPPPAKPKEKLGIKCEHCDATGVCAAGTPYDKSHGQTFGAKVLMTSCVECLDAAGEHRNSKKLVTCRICEGDGKV